MRAHSRRGDIRPNHSDRRADYQNDSRDQIGSRNRPRGRTPGNICNQLRQRTHCAALRSRHTCHRSSQRDQTLRTSSSAPFRTQYRVLDVPQFIPLQAHTSGAIPIVAQQGEDVPRRPNPAPLSCLRWTSTVTKTGERLIRVNIVVYAYLHAKYECSD